MKGRAKGLAGSVCRGRGRVVSLQHAPALSAVSQQPPCDTGWQRDAQVLPQGWLCTADSRVAPLTLSQTEQDLAGQRQVQAHRETSPRASGGGLRRCESCPHVTTLLLRQLVEFMWSVFNLSPLPELKRGTPLCFQVKAELSHTRVASRAGAFRKPVSKRVLRKLQKLSMLSAHQFDFTLRDRPHLPCSSCSSQVAAPAAAAAFARGAK